MIHLACFLVIKIEKTCFEALRRRMAKTLASKLKRHVLKHLEEEWLKLCCHLNDEHRRWFFFDDGRGKLVAQCVTCIIHTYVIVLGI
jgi:hypothetical protein